MDIRIKVIPGARKVSVSPLPDGRYRVAVRAKAKDGEANEEACAAIAAEFKVKSSEVSIIRGKTTPNKTLRVRGI